MTFFKRNLIASFIPTSRATSITTSFAAALAFTFTANAFAHDSNHEKQEQHKATSLTDKKMPDEKMADGKMSHEGKNYGAIKTETLSLEKGWIRQAPPAAKVMAGYVKITNNSNKTERLLGGTTDMAKRVEIHTMNMVDGIMKMAPLPKGLEIAPHETAVLKPGSFHIMFMGVKAPEPNAMVPVTLHFENAGSVTLTLPVMPAAKDAMKHAH